MSPPEKHGERGGTTEDKGTGRFVDGDGSIRLVISQVPALLRTSVEQGRALDNTHAQLERRATDLISEPWTTQSLAALAGCLLCGFRETDTITRRNAHLPLQRQTAVIVHIGIEQSDGQYDVMFDGEKARVQTVSFGPLNRTICSRLRRCLAASSPYDKADNLRGEMRGEMKGRHWMHTCESSCGR